MYQIQGFKLTIAFIQISNLAFNQIQALLPNRWFEVILKNT